MAISTTDPDIDVRIAEREVHSARARLGAELEAAGKTGRRALATLTRRIRPYAIGVALVGGAVLLAGIVRLVRGALIRPRPIRFALPVPRRSLSRQLFDTAVASAASAIANAAARKGAEMLKEGDAHLGGKSAGHVD